METQNLEWLVFNALHGDVNGDIPEDLQVMIKAEQELHALLARHNALVEAVDKVVTMYRKGEGHVCAHYPNGRMALDALAALVGEE